MGNYLRMVTHFMHKQLNLIIDVMSLNKINKKKSIFYVTEMQKPLF